MGIYTRNWTRRLIADWTEHILPLRDVFRPMNVLEIGVFEGRTSKWLLRNLLTDPGDRWYGVDPWELAIMGRRFPKDETGEAKMRAVESLARTTVRQYGGDRAIVCKGRSCEVLRDPAWLTRPLALAYIDGDHRPIHALEDTLLVWRLVQVGGIIVWDDYASGGKPLCQTLDLFLEAAAPMIEVLFRGHQIGVRKIGEEYDP